MHSNPIVIDDDDMDIEIPNNTSVALPRIDDVFEHKWAAAKYSMPGGMTDEEREKILLNRVTKFSTYGAKLDLMSESFHPPREPIYTEEYPQPLEHKLVLFGADLKKMRDLKKMFKTDCIFIMDESNYLLCYDNPEAAYEAIRINVLDPQVFHIKLETDEIELTKNWIQLKPYYSCQVERRMQLRYATHYDQQIKPKEEQIHYLKQIAKKPFEQDSQNESIYYRIKHERFRCRKSEERERRERSRDKKQLKEISDCSVIMGGDNADQSGSNMSFLISKSVKELHKLEDALANLDVLSRKSVEGERSNNSIKLSSNILNESMDCDIDIQESQPDKSEELSIVMQPVKAHGGFSYAEYVEKSDWEERTAKKIPVIDLIEP